MGEHLGEPLLDDGHKAMTDEIVDLLALNEGDIALMETGQLQALDTAKEAETQGETDALAGMDDLGDLGLGAGKLTMLDDDSIVDHSLGQWLTDEELDAALAEQVDQKLHLTVGHDDLATQSIAEMAQTQARIKVPLLMEQGLDPTGRGTHKDIVVEVVAQGIRVGKRVVLGLLLLTGLRFVGDMPQKAKGDEILIVSILLKR